MRVEYVDFNHAENCFTEEFRKEWNEVRTALRRMPVHLKASDQDKIQGSLIFDPVGTNAYIKRTLCRKPASWKPGIVIPRDYAFLGVDVDFVKRGVLVEAQFSNYPFFLNNVIRSELFYQSKVNLAGEPMQVLVLIANAKMFPASQSTLYFEQAKEQLDGLTKFHVVDVPVRLVGLFEKENTIVPAKFTKYSAARYSRTVTLQEDRQCQISRTKTRCTLRLV
jgi:hypothetical protein